MTTIHKLIFLSLLLLILTSCGTSGSGTAEVGGATVTLEWNYASRGIAAKQVQRGEVCAANNIDQIKMSFLSGTTVVQSQTFVCSVGTGTIDGIPVGSYTLQIEGVTNGAVSWRGTKANAVIVAGVITNFGTMTMNFVESPIIYTVTATAGTNGSITPAGSTTVASGQTKSFTVTPNSGYNIASVTGCGGSLSGNTYTTGAITGDCTVTPNFSLTPATTYTVTATAGANGSITPGGASSVTSGQTKSFTVAPNSGYTIASVSGCNGSLSGNTYTTGTITGACTVAASFSLTPSSTYSISGIVATAASTGISGVTLSLTGTGTTTALTDSSGNYSFSGAANGGYTLTPSLTGYSFSPLDRAITVSGANLPGQNFTGTPPVITVSTAVPSSNGSINPTSRSVASGSTTTFTVTPNSGYQISSVTGCNGSLSGTTYTTGAITGSCTVTANFTSLVLATLTDPTTGMVLQKVTGGTFTMGDTFGDGFSNELPTHRVTVGDFYIGKYEVTQGEWQAVMGSNPSSFSSCGTNCPVETVSWDDVQTFITTLNQRGGNNYRLPTEAEWEYAARSGGKSEKYSGSSNVNAVAWYLDNSGGTTHPVGQKQANGLGLYDMNGNVFEWVNDWNGSYSSTAQTNPTGPSTGIYRVLRGGCLSNAVDGVRASYRDYFGPQNFRNAGIGFRLAAPVPDATITDPTTGMVLQKVTGGTFTMGDTFGDGFSDELPAHQVTVGNFYIGKYEVTQGEWQAVMGSNPSNFTSCGITCPVENVSWSDIQTFITTLNQMNGKNYRLPTEAEWEYAARSGGKNEKYSGSSDVNAVAWYNGNSGGTTHPVGQKQANGLGLYDMSGNVNELVGDWYGAYSNSAQTNPTGPSAGSGRVPRGGFWDDNAFHVRASLRGGSLPPDNGGSWVGFRLAAPVQ
jgi:formylglycine-generating enzyme required for sulfatase activity